MAGPGWPIVLARQIDTGDTRTFLRQCKSNPTLVGFVDIVDQSRGETPEVINTTYGAAIQIFMATEDFSMTACAIAVQRGRITVDQTDDESDLKFGNVRISEDLQDDEMIVPIDEASRRALILSGPVIATLTTAKWNTVGGYDEVVFARTTIDHKLLIVQELQSRGLVVGMTSAGINDTPSPEAADVGIAMGSGSDVADEAPDTVLLDSFSAMVEAVRYGRVVDDKLKKTICYSLPAESFPSSDRSRRVLLSVFMKVICYFTECAPATTIVYVCPEADVLTRGPRNVKADRLVDQKLTLQAQNSFRVLETLCSSAMAYWYCQPRALPYAVQ